MTYITFAHGDAQEALEQFLSGDDDGRDRDGRRIARNIARPDDSGLAAVIVDPAEYEELHDAQAALRDWLTPRPDDDPDGYRPFRHSPKAQEDRLLPIGPLQDPLARLLCGRPFEELEAKDRDRVAAAAMVCLLDLRLDPDDSGAVPVMMHAHNAEPRDAARPLKLWRIAYKSDVHGLYLRVSASGFFGEEWEIVTGSGFRVASGFFGRDTAAAALSAIGRVLPQVNWMTVRDASVFTPNALDALRQVFARYRESGVNAAVPEPEPVTETAEPA
ncbi:hypothetical protein [Nonomuraea sp. NPDC050643]|uniref:hypothetical protein n=1 Tax=Nonomuraea sp. NPDC050643 TaxID=3155660 RepID=UPI0033D933D6